MQAQIGYRRKERRARTIKDCCLRAAVAIELLTRKKTAAWISSALEAVFKIIMQQKNEKPQTTFALEKKSVAGPV